MIVVLPAISFIALTAFETALPLWAASSAAFPAICSVCKALSAFCLILAAISSIEEDACSADAACSVAPRLKFNAIEDIHSLTVSSTSIPSLTVPCWLWQSVQKILFSITGWRLGSKNSACSCWWHLKHISFRSLGSVTSEGPAWTSWHSKQETSDMAWAPELHVWRLNVALLEWHLRHTSDCAWGGRFFRSINVS